MLLSTARPSILLRLLMLVVVACGTVGGATASALAELHEISHGGHAVTKHVSDATDVGHDDDDAGARLLHALVHCGHCHGQGGVLPLAGTGWELASPPALRAPAMLAQSLSPSPRESLLRPPIQA